MSDNPNISFKTLSQFVLTDASGRIDFDATMAKFAARVTEYEAAVNMETEHVANAINKVFDTYPINLTMDSVAAFALPELNPTPDNIAILKERIKDYIRNNADHPDEKPGTRLFSIIRGKQGGVRRNSDYVLKPTE